MCVIFAKKSLVATKLREPGAKLGGGCAPPGPGLKPPLSMRREMSSSLRPFGLRGESLNCVFHQLTGRVCSTRLRPYCPIWTLIIQLGLPLTRSAYRDKTVVVVILL